MLCMGHENNQCWGFMMWRVTFKIHLYKVFTIQVRLLQK